MIGSELLVDTRCHGNGNDRGAGTQTFARRDLILTRSGMAEMRWSQLMGIRLLVVSRPYSRRVLGKKSNVREAVSGNSRGFGEPAAGDFNLHAVAERADFAEREPQLPRTFLAALLYHPNHACPE